MSWTDELYKIYEYNCGRKFQDGEPVLLPVFHSKANAQIEITINEKGDFINAAEIDKKDAETIIPVTEKSGARSGSGAIPMPFADKLVYIAGDYSKYALGKRVDNSKFFSAYMNQLKQWCDSEYSHTAVKSVNAYLEKNEVMYDLIKSGILELDDDTGKLKEKVKISGIAQEDSFVRFIVNYNDLTHESKTWLDKTLYDSFIAFNSRDCGKKDLCYAVGKELAITYNHPRRICNSVEKAKLISANDESGFTYRGRFSSKEEAFSISYEFSQKLHNALKWIIEKQGMRFDSLTMIVWASAMAPVPDIQKSCYDEEEFEESDSEQIPDTMPIYMSNLKKRILGYQQKFTVDTKVMIMGFDAATVGRLSISVYDELAGSQFLENVENWHRDIAWFRFNIKLKKYVINSFSIYEIIKCAFGTSQKQNVKENITDGVSKKVKKETKTIEFIDCKDDVLKDNVLRLIPCITQGRKLPNDILKNLYYKASNPLAYEQKSNHSKVLEVACAMIRKSCIDNKKD